MLCVMQLTSLCRCTLREMIFEAKFWENMRHRHNIQLLRGSVEALKV